MEMFLMLVCISLFSLALTGLAFSAATRPEQTAPAPETERETAITVPPARFFGDGAVAPAATQVRVPLEALLLQIESHVRLEQAAAESFLVTPTPALLHSRTASPLLN